MAKLAASEAATAISHQVSIPGAWTCFLGQAPGVEGQSVCQPPLPQLVLSWGSSCPCLSPWGAVSSLLSPCFPP